MDGLFIIDLFNATASWPPRVAYKDFLFSKKLRIKNYSERLTRSAFKKLQEVERQIIPPENQVYSKMKNRRELRKYVLCFDNSQLDCFLDEGCFMLCVRFYNSVELYDIQSANENYGRIFKAIEHIARRYSNDDIYTFSREKTSYNIYKLFQKRGDINITMDKPEVFRGEKYHRMIFNITDKFKKRLK